MARWAPATRTCYREKRMRLHPAFEPGPIARATGVVRARILPVSLPRRRGRRDRLGPGVPDDSVAARVDIEEPFEPFARPGLERVERGRDFFITDGTCQALVCLARDDDPAGRLHDDVELHLEAPFDAVELDADAWPGATGRPRTAYVRTLRAGDTIYLRGRSRLQPHDPELGAQVGGYRGAPSIAVFSADEAPLHLYDDAAFHQLAAWEALPWYRKLSVLARNR